MKLELQLVDEHPPVRVPIGGKDVGSEFAAVYDADFQLSVVPFDGEIPALSASRGRRRRRRWRSSG